jgi:hypothetical protein
VVVGIGVALAATGASCSHEPEASSPASISTCGASQEPHVAVHARDHLLLLCDDGRAVRSFGVRLASGGTGKTREGDKKMPVGRYPLGDATASKEFGLFIPIGYPTPAQRAQGLTGGSLGIHGPARGARWLGGLVNTFDTTDGCVGIATDGEMEELLNLLRAHRVRFIVLAAD